jgi:hypothetical protein
MDDDAYYINILVHQANKQAQAASVTSGIARSTQYTTEAGLKHFNDALYHASMCQDAAAECRYLQIAKKGLETVYDEFCRAETERERAAKAASLIPTTGSYQGHRAVIYDVMCFFKF